MSIVIIDRIIAIVSQRSVKLATPAYRDDDSSRGDYSHLPRSVNHQVSLRSCRKIEWTHWKNSWNLMTGTMTCLSNLPNLTQKFQKRSTTGFREQCNKPFLSRKKPPFRTRIHGFERLKILFPSRMSFGLISSEIMMSSHERPIICRNNISLL